MASLDEVIGSLQEVKEKHGDASVCISINGEIYNIDACRVRGDMLGLLFSRDIVVCEFVADPIPVKELSEEH